MSDLLSDVLWVEKYRPTSLDEMALSEENRTLISGYLEQGEIPHLLLSGPPGTGKTTIARIINSHLDCAVLSLNASNERGIDTIREKVTNFAGAATEQRWNHAFLDEADAMTSDGQTSLRNLMEKYHAQCRFILTCNYLYKIIGAIQSRCLHLPLGSPPLKERFLLLQRVLQAEGIEADVPTTMSYVERFPDIRRMLMGAQRAFRSSTEGILPPAEESGVQGGDILKLVKEKNYTGLRRLTADGSFDPQQALRDLFWSIPDKDPHVGLLRHKIGMAVHESGYTPDPVIHFLGSLAEVMREV